MNNKRTPIIISVILGLVLVALFAWPKINNPNGAMLAQLEKAGIECIGSHNRAGQHFHPHLSVVVDGLDEGIPASVGVVSNCMAEIHTHDAAGTIHVETIDADKVVYLRDFFTVLGKSIERDGYNVTMSVDEKENLLLGDLILNDGQRIVLEYTKKSL